MIRIIQKEFTKNKSYFNQNILRSGGRLEFSDLPEVSKNTILQAKQSDFIFLVILFSHLQKNMAELKTLFHKFVRSIGLLALDC